MLSSKLQLTLRDRKVLAAILALVILCSGISLLIGYQIAKAQTSTLTMQTNAGGIYAGAPTWTVFVDGGAYYAKDAWGATSYPSTVASTTINSVLTAMTAGQSLKLVIGSANWSITTSLTPPSGVTIYTDLGNPVYATSVGHLVWAGSTNTPMFDCRAKNGITFEGLVLDGNNVAGSRGILGGRTSAGGDICYNFVLRDCLLNGFTIGFDGGAYAEPLGYDQPGVAVAKFDNTQFSHNSVGAIVANTENHFDKCDFVHNSVAHLEVVGKSGYRLSQCQFSGASPQVQNDILFNVTTGVVYSAVAEQCFFELSTAGVVKVVNPSTTLYGVSFVDNYIQTDNATYLMDWTKAVEISPLTYTNNFCPAGAGSRIVYLPNPNTYILPNLKAIGNSGMNVTDGMESLSYDASSMGVSGANYLATPVFILNDQNRVSSTGFTSVNMGGTHFPSCSDTIILLVQFRSTVIGTGDYSYVQLQKSGTSPYYCNEVDVNKNELNGAWHSQTFVLQLNSTRYFDYSITVATGWTVDTRLILLGYMR